ncbi:MAG: hypothetical protein ABSB32_23490 [Thermodesulfobacteriota bacterium]
MRAVLTKNSGVRSEDELFSVEDTADLFKATKAQIYQRVNRARNGYGDFPHLTIGRLL